MRAPLCVLVRMCACALGCACGRVCAYYNEKKMPGEWQARQVIPAILQVSSSEQNAKKYTRVRATFYQSIIAKIRACVRACVCVCVCVCVGGWVCMCEYTGQVLSQVELSVN